MRESPGLTSIGDVEFASVVEWCSKANASPLLSLWFMILPSILAFQWGTEVFSSMHYSCTVLPFFRRKFQYCTVLSDWKLYFSHVSGDLFLGHDFSGSHCFLSRSSSISRLGNCGSCLRTMREMLLGLVMFVEWSIYHARRSFMLLNTMCALFAEANDILVTSALAFWHWTLPSERLCMYLRPGKIMTRNAPSTSSMTDLVCLTF